MADIELVIKMSKESYEQIIEEGDLDYLEVITAIENGTPLPKGHGRLIDADYLKDVTLLHNWHGNNKNIVPYSDRRGYRLRDNEVLTALINASTIIEADTAESEDRCKNCEYSHNPDYTRCHECKAESEDK